MSRTAVIALGRFLQPHFYWSGNLKKAYASKLSYPVFAVWRLRGELVVCGRNLCETVALKRWTTRFSSRREDFICPPNFSQSKSFCNKSRWNMS